MFAAPIAAVCVLCCGDILKKGDKNLIEGRTEFSPKSEIVSLDFSVELNSSYICRSCLVKLKKRRALISHLREVNDSLRQIYWKSLNAKSNSFNVRPDAMQDSLCALKQPDLQDPRLPDRPVAIAITSSTPRKDHEQAVFLPTVSPIRTQIMIADAVETSKASEAQEKKTTVQVRVDWPSKSKTNILHEGLESLGKMLCCGNYKQIARAVWKNAILKKHVQQLFLKEIDHECTALCSQKEASSFRSTSENPFF